jgi:6-pyruvoyltetrahydropterin/6-carboxytetrahydropterin synthase
MFRLEKRFAFEAAHRLPNHDGKCARLHGHSWKGVVVVQGGVLQREGPKAGMLVDFGDLKAAIDPIVEKYLDHWELGETTGLANPTSEELARWIYNKLKGAGRGLLEGLICVRIEETCTSAAEYWG